MRNLILASLVAFIFSTPAVAQENFVNSSSSAALTGARSEVGVSFGGVSVASVVLATALVTALLALMLEGNSTTPSTSATN